MTDTTFNENRTVLIEAAVLAEVEADLLEYVEKYGVTDRAQNSLQQLSRRKTSLNHID
jgi:hypothetical protein